MCGICGQYNIDDRQSIDRNVLVRMARTMIHRGPDDEGFYVSGRVGLGFRRLSIIDISGGHQPMSNHSKNTWVAFNGEIYNFPELRDQLENLGHCFRTQSDTEVIVHGFQQWGSGVLQHLNGMFGLAIWDERQQQLMVARDRMGIKPIYYRIEDDQLMFSSEIRALLATRNQKPRTDIRGMQLFMQYRYVPAPYTMFEGIRKLAPGTMLIASNGQIRTERWWNFHPIPFDPMPSATEAENTLLELYRSAVKRHLISDVPVGILLSGGLDSGLLLALANESGEQLQSFTVGFGQGVRNDELEAASETAALLHSSHHSVQLSHHEFDDTLTQIVRILEEPVAAASIVPLFHLCKRARQNVTVALMGQGPDELFGGYKRHIGVRYGWVWRGMPRFAREHLCRVIEHLPRNEALKRAAFSLGNNARMRRYMDVFSLKPHHKILDLFRSEFLPDDTNGTEYEFWADLEPLMQNLDELGGFQFLEIRSSLPDELLMYADKMSMAHSLEIRVPFLDKEIVEYAERLDSSLKVRLFSGKWLHRRICKRYLSQEIMQRRKIGFFVPVDDWFRGNFSFKIDSLLLQSDAQINKYLRPEAVKEIVDMHRSGRDDNTKILFSLVVVEEWLRTFIS